MTVFIKKSNILAVILNYNNSLDTLNLIKCLDKTGVDIFLLDNGSEMSDRETLQLGLKDHTLNIELQMKEENHGFGGGVNFGIKFSEKYDYDFVVLLNNDLSFEEKDIFNECVQLIESERKIGCVGVEHRCENGTIESLGGGVVHPLIGWGKLSKKSDKFLEKKYGYIMGSFFFLPVRVIREVGYFDERFFIYFEEADFCLRLKAIGYRLATLSNKFVYHKGSATYGGKTNGFYERYSRSSTKYVMKWKGKAFACVSIVLSSILSLFFSSRRKYLKTIIRSHVEGLL